MPVGRWLLPGIAGASLWTSFGTLAVPSASTLRVGTLPPLWLLALLIVIGALAGVVSRMSTSALWPLALTVLLWLPWLPIPVPAAFLI